MVNIIPIEKNKEYIIEVESVSSDGNGVAHIDGYAVFVPNSVPGDVLKILAVKVKTNYGYGKITEIIKPSADRTDSRCEVFQKCGGCNFMHISYPEQLEIKKGFVADAISRLGGFKDVEVSEIIGMDEPFRYRNKMVFPFGKNKDGDIIFGFFRERSHDIIPLSDCMLGNKIYFEILSEVKSYMKKYGVEPYNEARHTGVVRRVFIRESYHTGEIMVVVSANADTLPESDKLIGNLRKISDKIVSIVLNIHTKKNNLVLGEKNTLLFGKPVISDSICGLEYEISPHSFFQINPVQTEKLYKKAIEYADIDTEDTVLDVYCGIGTISLYAAQYAKKVVGVEIVPQAIENAKENALRNNVANAEFYAADAQELVPKLINDGVKPDVVILDPPRKGSDEDTLSAVASANPKRIVYVSCNPATLARDMKFLAQLGYKPEKVSAVDMFPQTCHVESVVLMSKG